MKTRFLIGLSACAALAVTAPAAFADNGSKGGKKRGKAVQVQIEKDSGHKISPSDQVSDEASDQASPTAVISDPRGLMPRRAEPVQYHADGSRSIRLGLENLEYTVLTIDDNGKKSMSHRSLKEIEGGLTSDATGRGEK